MIERWYDVGNARHRVLQFEDGVLTFRAPRARRPVALLQRHVGHFLVDVVLLVVVVLFRHAAVRLVAALAAIVALRDAVLLLETEVIVPERKKMIIQRIFDDFRRFSFPRANSG